MSLLGNRNNDFEKKLKKQLDDTELRPSESLWDRIDREVNRPEFEQKIEGKIGKYDLKPKPETWTYIEEQLPPEPSRWKRAGKIWYSIAILLFFGGAFTGYQLSNLPVQDIANIPSVTIEPADRRPEKIREIVGGTDRQVEEMTPEKPVTGAVPPEKADKITVAGRQSITSNEAGTLSPNVTGSKMAAPGMPLQRTAASRVPEQKHASQQAGSVKRQAGALKQTVSTQQKSIIYSQSSRGNRAVSKTTGDQNIAGKSSLSYRRRATRGSVSDSSDKTISSFQQTGHNSNVQNREPAGSIVTTPETPADNNIVVAIGQVKNKQAQVPERNNDHDQPASSEQTAEIITQEVAALPVTQHKDTSVVVSSGKPMLPVSDSVNRENIADFNQIETQAPTRLSITVMAGLHQSNMKLAAPEGRKSMEENVALRRQTEMPKIDFTGGFLLDYEVSSRVLISSGILFTGFSMNLKYNISPASKEASPQPGATYTNVADSIEQGSGMSNRIHYSWNEIPLFVTFRINNPSKRLGIETKTGISYAILNSVDAAMVGQENIGVLLLKNKESFPYMKNSFFVHLYAGISYRLNESVALQLMPYFRYSLSNMIDNENWVKQYPWVMGLNFGLRKSF